MFFVYVLIGVVVSSSTSLGQRREDEEGWCSFSDKNYTELGGITRTEIFEDQPIGETFYSIYMRNISETELETNLKPTTSNPKYEMFQKYFEFTKNNGNISLSVKTQLTDIFYVDKYDDFLLGTLKCKPESGSDKTLTVQVTIKPINRHDPTFNKANYEFTVSELFPVKITFADSSNPIIATDRDFSDEYNELSFKLYTKNQSTVESTTFKISPIKEKVATSDTGSKYKIDLELLQPLDYNENSEHQLVIETKDKSKPPVTREIKVHVKDEDTLDPVFDEPVYMAKVSKTQLELKEVVLETTKSPIRAVDADVGIRDKVIYSFKPAQPHLKLIENIADNTVKVTVIEPGKLIGLGQIVAVIEASETSNINRKTQTILLIEIEQPDPTTTPKEDPVFVQQEYTIILLDSQKIGSVVLVVVAKPDATYKIEDNGGFFEINGLTGEVTLKTKFNMKQKIFEVYALSDGVKKDTATVSVQLIQQNSSSIHFPQSYYEWNIDENVPGLTMDLSIREPTSRYTITYSSTPNKFNIDFTTGILSYDNPFDYEKKSSYRLKIMVHTEEIKPSNTDILNVAINEAVISINIMDVNEPPFFNEQSQSIAVAPFHQIGHSYQTKQAHDLDSGPNGILTYSMTDETANTFFLLSRKTGELKLQNSSGTNFRFKMTVDDQGVPSLTAQSEVNVYFIQKDEVFLVVFNESFETVTTQESQRSIVKNLGEALNVSVGLLQWKIKKNSGVRPAPEQGRRYLAASNTEAEFHMFAERDQKVLKYTEITSLMDEKKSDINDIIGAHEFLQLQTENDKDEGKEEDKDEDKDKDSDKITKDENVPSASTVAVYILSAIVFILVAAGTGLFICNRWSKRAKRTSSVSSVSDSYDNPTVFKIDDESSVKETPSPSGSLRNKLWVQTVQQHSEDYDDTVIKSVIDGERNNSHTSENGDLKPILKQAETMSVDKPPHIRIVEEPKPQEPGYPPNEVSTGNDEIDIGSDGEIKPESTNTTNDKKDNEPERTNFVIESNTEGDLPLKSILKNPNDATNHTGRRHSIVHFTVDMEVNRNEDEKQYEKEEESDSKL